HRLKLTAIKMSDGPVGVRNYGPATTMGGIALAATWDFELVHKLGSVLGDDSRARGVHILLGPGVNIYRAPVAGRNFEYFGEDPFLASRIAVAYIEGLQSKGVCATVKHFIGNNQEYRPPQRRLPHRRTHHARDIPPHLRGSRETGPRVRHHGLLQSHQRPAHVAKRVSQQ